MNKRTKKFIDSSNRKKNPLARRKRGALKIGASRQSRNGLTFKVCAWEANLDQDKHAFAFWGYIRNVTKRAMNNKYCAI